MKSPVKQHDRDQLTRKIKAAKVEKAVQRLNPRTVQVFDPACPTLEYQLIQMYPGDDVVADEMFDTLTEALVEGTLALRQGKNITIRHIDPDK